MKILIDTNVLISAAINQNGVPYQAYEKAVTPPNTGIISEVTLKEIPRIYQKIPGRAHDWDQFFHDALRNLQVISLPEDVSFEEEYLLRDIADRPILRAALFSETEILLSGDKDFIESGLTRPVIMTPAQFLTMGQLKC